MSQHDPQPHGERQTSRPPGIGAIACLAFFVVAWAIPGASLAEAAPSVAQAPPIDLGQPAMDVVGTEAAGAPGSRTQSTPARAVSLPDRAAADRAEASREGSVPRLLCRVVGWWRDVLESARGAWYGALSQLLRLENHGLR